MDKTDNRLGHISTMVKKWKWSNTCRAVGKYVLNQVLRVATVPPSPHGLSPGGLLDLLTVQQSKEYGLAQQRSSRNLLQHQEEPLFWLVSASANPREGESDLGEGTAPWKAIPSAHLQTLFTANRCFQLPLHGQLWELQSPRDVGSEGAEERQTVEQQAGWWANTLAVNHFKHHP